MHARTHARALLRTRSLTHSLPHSAAATRSVTHSLTHSLTHSRMHRRTRTLVHIRTITALMLNPEEDLLYSGATDRLIKVRSGASLQAIPCWFAHASGSGWSLLSSAPVPSGSIGGKTGVRCVHCERARSPSGVGSLGRRRRAVPADAECTLRRDSRSGANFSVLNCRRSCH